MTTYLLKTIRRDPDGDSPGRRTDEATVEASTEDEAKLAAQRLANTLSPEHFVTLCNEDGDMLWVTERQNA